jgi:hypothetical protein
MMGFLTMVIYICSFIVIPLALFSYIDTYNVGGVQLGVENITSITYWIISFGILITATAFFSASSPDRSKRKGIIEIVQVILNTCYIYMYKFSGASSLVLNLTGTVGLDGFIAIDLSNLVYLWMGSYALSLIIAVINLLDYVIYRNEKKGDQKKKPDSKQPSEEFKVSV